MLFDMFLMKMLRLKRGGCADRRISARGRFVIYSPLWCCVCTPQTCGSIDVTPVKVNVKLSTSLRLLPALGFKYNLLHTVFNGD